MDEHPAEQHKKKPEWRKFLPHFAFVALIFLGVGALAGTALNAPASAPTTVPTVIPTQSGVNEEELKATVEEYVNAKLLAGSGAEGVVSSVKKGDNAYELALNILQGGAVVDSVTVYASFDGSTLYTAAFDLNEPLPSPQPTESAELEKAETPVVEVFVMTYCPYGTQFEKALLPVVNLLGEKADFSIKFVSYAMHGETEIVENSRQYCVEEEYGKPKFYEYLECFLADGNASHCLTDLELDSESIDACINATHEEFEVSYEAETGQRYPAYPIHAADNEKYGVGGSPTFVLNGKVLQVSRNPEAIKQAVCNAFLEPPAECSETLSSDGTSPGFGYEGTGGGSESCA